MDNTNYETIIKLIAQITKDGKPVNEIAVAICATPTIIVDNTHFNQHPLMIYGKAINKVIFEHGVTPNILTRLQKILENPQRIYHSDSQVTLTLKGSIVVVTKEIIGEDQLIIALQPDVNVGHKIVNRVGSIYAKPIGVINGWDLKGLRIYP